MQKKKKIVFIGDSIINGFPLKRSVCFVSLFREKTGFEVINKGENGETSSAILSRFEKDVLNHKPDEVAIMCGGNDFYFSKPAEKVFNTILEMAEIAIEADIKPIILTPLLIDVELAPKQWSPIGDYEYMYDNLKKLGDFFKELGVDAKEHLTVVDTQGFFQKQYNKDNVKDYMHDGIHPTEKGHLLLSDFLVKEIGQK